MDKRELILVTLMGIATIAIISAGYHFSDNRQEELLAEGQAIAAQQAVTGEDAAAASSAVENPIDVENILADFEADRTQTTLIQYFHYVLQNRQQVKVALFGQLGEPGALFRRELEAVAAEQKMDNFLIQSFDVGAGGSYDFLVENWAADIQEMAHDVVFFFAPSLADARQDIALEESLYYQYAVYQQLKEQSPDALIVFVTSPAAAEEAFRNSRLLEADDYSDYLTEQNEIHSVPTLDLVKELEPYPHAEDLFTAKSDEFTENGEKLYRDTVEAVLTAFRLDTTSGAYFQGEKPAAFSLAPVLDALYAQLFTAAAQVEENAPAEEDTASLQTEDPVAAEAETQPEAAAPAASDPDPSYESESYGPSETLGSSAASSASPASPENSTEPVTEESSAAEEETSGQETESTGSGSAESTENVSASSGSSSSAE